MATPGVAAPGVAAPGVATTGQDDGRRRDPDPTRRLAALAIAAAWLLPPRLAAGGPVLCPFRRATGLPCPACGLTRSWAAALHGRPGASLRHHPLGLLALGTALAYAARLDERPGHGPDVRPGGAWPAVVGAWLAVWVARMARTARSGR